MRLQLDDVAPLRGPRLVTLGAGGLASSTGRREFLQRALAVGAGVGLATLGVFPSARRASAQHGTWKIWDGCAGLGSWVDDDGCRGCNQGSKLCCCNSNGYHQGPEQNCHTKHRPDQCKDDPNSTDDYDGWTWRTSTCCVISSGVCKSGRKWRCSDGYYRDSCSSTDWVTSICRVVVDSGDGCGPCPI